MWDGSVLIQPTDAADSKIELPRGTAAFHNGKIVSELRPSTEHDIPAITAIYGHYVRTHLATFEIVPPDEGEIGRRRLDVVGRGLPYLVAEMDGQVAGYAYASPYRPRPAYRYTVEDSIYIHPAHVGKGLGRLLLTALLEACEQAGCRQMIAVIGDSENAASIGLHSALGFHQVGILHSVGLKFGRWVDSVLMQRSLGESDKTPPVDN